MAQPASQYFLRSLDRHLRAAASQFPVVTVTGPRQSGKTTLLRHFFGQEYSYVLVDTPDARAAILSDPRSFFTLNPPPVIFDEIQETPELFPYVKQHVDEHRSEPAQFILSGSHNILLSQRVAESLAGRTAVLDLFPFTLRELAGEPDRALPWERAGEQPASAPLEWSTLPRRLYPQVARDAEDDPAIWYSSYVRTFLERDVRSFRLIGDITQFQIFLRALALRSAQLLNLSDLARDLGLAVNTVKAWISVLEACYVVIILRPWYQNAGKRLVKTPKVYFLDTGLLCYLCGLADPAAIRLGPMAGPVMETLVVTEVYKTLAHRGLQPRLYFWRTSAGREVDLVVETPDGLIPIEIKASSTIWPEMAASIEVFRKDYRQARKGWVIYSGDTIVPAGPHATAWPVTAM